MFNRAFKTEIDDREEMKKTIDLLKPQIDSLKAKADAEGVEKQKELVPQLAAFVKRRQAEIPAL